MNLEHRNIHTTLALGFTVLTLSVLSFTSAEAACRVLHGKYAEKCSCPKGETSKFCSANEVTCCTTPSEPYATGESKSERDARHQGECQGKGMSYDSARGTCRPVKNIGKKERPAAIEAAECQRQGMSYDSNRGTCRPVKNVAKRPQINEVEEDDDRRSRKSRREKFRERLEDLTDDVRGRRNRHHHHHED